jgi:hypothetical protein
MNQLTVAEIQSDYDWKAAFEVSCRDLIRPAVPNSKVSLQPAINKDVKTVIAAINGANDGDGWLGIFELNDGRFVSISASCDYTGWGCRDGGEMLVAESLVDIVRFGLTDNERLRLGIVLV